MAGDSVGELDPESTRSSVGRRDTFVVRIWPSDASDVVRGQIQHVGTRRRVYFASRERLQGFIEERLRRAEDQTWRS